MNPKIDPTLKELHEANQKRADSAGDSFPDTWNPSDPTHPNPITMVAFPPLQKPQNASSYLIEATHMDGHVYTIWLSDSLLKSLLRADVQEGMPVSIHRSAEKHAYEHPGLGKTVHAWSWTVTTPQNQDLPLRSSGAAISIGSLRSQVPLEATVELPAKTALSEALESQTTVTPDDIPF